MKNIILILFLLTLSSNKFLERETLPEELDDDIILQKGGFGGGFHGPSINIRPTPVIKPTPVIEPKQAVLNNWIYIYIKYNVLIDIDMSKIFKTLTVHRNITLNLKFK